MCLRTEGKIRPLDFQTQWHDDGIRYLRDIYIYMYNEKKNHDNNKTVRYQDIYWSQYLYLHMYNKDSNALPFDVDRRMNSESCVGVEVEAAYVT